MSMQKRVAVPLVFMCYDNKSNIKLRFYILEESVWSYNEPLQFFGQHFFISQKCFRGVIKTLKLVLFFGIPSIAVIYKNKSYL